ncbi:DNA-3-methyladenine glycosylase family protein [Zhihengliuella flava]|uniref:3-methyladenine DNA glycosylase/8-oxoguanine DNA glycosylase n=1 Tax=Zhihengliuella flava TaxID=1285193 RepID=A0A931GFF2_9MICC|nr:DNA-3-methyladenine glycosylase 2 family protein [Zhihengliuella flava]MBG6085323.1 3-methyladenine DNA glycosylase/8-oxoguanine DNA glycosylase [Zhihengliuella flava]
MTRGEPAPIAQGQWRPSGPYSLSQTLGVLQRGRHDPTLRVTPAGAWAVFRYGEAGVTLRVSVRDDVVTWHAWGEGARAPGLAAAVERLLGAEDDWDGFDALDLPTLVRRSRRERPGLRLPATGRVFDALMPAVLEQKVTTDEARFAWRYLVRNFGDAAPAHPDLPAEMRLAPTPQQLRRVPSWRWHQARVDAARSRTLLRAAESASGLNRLGSVRGTQEAAEAMMSLPGIGPWTAAEVLQRTHGDPDRVSVGDYHLPHLIGEALTGRRTDDAGMLEVLAPWTGHRQRVVRLITATGFRHQARGPRLAPRDYRRF